MSQSAGRPPASQVPLRGAVDLAALAAAAKRREQAAAAGPSAAAGAPSGLVVEATEAGFQDLVDRSVDVPVVIDLQATWSEQSTALSAVLVQLVTEYAGRFLLATVDVDANPRIAQLFQAQSIPTVVAVVKGQPVPLFSGPLPQAQVRSYLDELLKVAAANGVTGTVPVGPVDPAAEPEIEPDLPPLHQEAFDAIERGDLDAAAAAYEKAIAQSPADADAKDGLAQVNLLRRTEGADVVAARAAAAEAPADPDAQILLADLDLLGGHVDDALRRLVDTVRITTGAEREQVRKHLIELFDVIGQADPAVVAARKALTAALF
jgi:putative thioredoxin